MCFDKIEYTTGLYDKFFTVYGRIFFLLINFLRVEVIIKTLNNIT